MDYCLNCGHTCHCDDDCLQEYDKGQKIVCCTTCRCESDEESYTIPEDLFNGA